MNRARWMLTIGSVFVGVAALVWPLWSLPGGARPAQAVAAAEPDSPGAVTTAALPDGLVTLWVQFASRMTPAGPEPQTRWDGRLTVSQGTLHSLRLWQRSPGDAVDGAGWSLVTRRESWWAKEELKKGHEPPPPPAAALVVELAQSSGDTTLGFETAQGSFKFSLKEIPWGAPPKPFLEGLVHVARAASSGVALSAPSEDDFPSAALGPDGELYVAYVAFTHGKDFRRAGPLDAEPQSFEYLAQPAGGDQVMLLRLDGRRWTGPAPVTPPGQDVFRTAAAVDGSGRLWVFWTAKADGTWDLFARCLDRRQWAEPLRLTSGDGADVFPAAVTDSAGRVWVAWQSFAGDHSVIRAARQEGTRFGRTLLVADHGANAWTPAVAAARDGRVAFAWDTYAKGDYDVYCREWSGGSLGPMLPVAASYQAEMRPAAIFDHAGRLWIAYETSPEGWGKDFGALVKTGVPLYRGRSVAVRVWADSRWWEPAEDPAAALSPARVAGPRKGLLSLSGGYWYDYFGDPLTAGPRVALPRLTTDAAGRVWLAVRSPALGSRMAVGSSWFEHLAWYEGDRWSGQIICPQTDNLLDSRPALVGLPSGEVVLVAASDMRSATAGRTGAGAKPGAKRGARAKPAETEPAEPASRWPDPINNELVLARMGPAPAGGPSRAELKPAAAAEPGQPSAAAQQEAAAVARARAARVTVGGKTLRLLRGEFHRHTEISQDGGNDGTLMDMWRYALDAAAQDWVGNGDHDNGGGREYSWWITQKTTDLFTLPGVFTPMFTYERSVSSPDGHRTAVFSRRGIRTLPRLRGGQGKPLDELPAEAARPNSPDVQMFYRYLEHFDGVCASHTSGTTMGTAWRDNNPKVEPIVEIYQGCRQSYEMPGAPRSNTAEYSLGGWKPYGFVSLALRKGYRLGFQASSDHISTHISFCNCWVEEPTREGILAAMKARRVYGATDHIVAEFRCGQHFMGEEFSLAGKPTFQVRMLGTGPLAKVHIIKDGNYVYTQEPNRREVAFEWTDLEPLPGATSYYYVRGEQADGELVWVSPMWITCKAR